MTELELVIPCFNEAASLPALLEEIESLRGLIPVVFVLVDNGSSDETLSILNQTRRDNLRLIRLDANRGYGGGIVAGLSTCTAPMVGWMHADLQIRPSVLLQLNIDNASWCLTKGMRRGRKLDDRLFTAGMSLTETVLFKRKLSDINGQPTIFPRVWFEGLNSPPHDFSLDLFVYLRARQEGLPVVRLPVQFGKRFAGVSSWNTGIKSRLRFIKRTLRYSFELRRRDHENL